MIRWTIVAAACLSLLPGCGRSHQPTVRQSTIEAGEKGKTGAMPRDAIHAGLADAPHPEGTRPGASENKASPHASGPGPTLPEIAARSQHPSADPASPIASAASSPNAAKQVAGKGGSPAHSREVRIGDVQLVAPEGWVRKTPPIAFILAEFSLPRAEGDAEDAQLTVTAVGENNPKNLDRFRDELKKKPEQGSVEHLKINGVEVILVDASPSAGGGPGPVAAAPGGGCYRILNAIVPVGNKLYFINCSGPEKTVGARAGEFRAFLETMKSIQSP